MNLKYFRELRTSSSESYAVISNDEYVGHLSLHFGDTIKGILLLESDFYDKEDIGFEDLSSIHKVIEEEIIPLGKGENLRLSIARGDQVFYSLATPPDASNEIATKGDLGKLKGKIKDLSGKLTEYIVVDYFKYHGYDSYRAGSELDHKKVDVIAIKNETTIYAQVKNGKISDKEIEKIIRFITCLDKVPEKIAIFAQSYSSYSELFRADLEQKYNTRILLITKNDVISCLPEHKRHDRFTSQL